MKHLLKLQDLDKEEILDILNLADQLKYENHNGIEHHILKGKTLGMIFQKSSTRTRVSFETGMYQLGGQALFLSNRDLQIGRGEPVEDTARVLSRYLDGIMIRTFEQKEVDDLAKYGSIPIINGLTDYCHPCQVLADLMTIRELRGSLDNFTIGLCGDLKFGRTVHSLIKTMSHFEGNSFVLISTKELSIPDYIKDIMDKASCPYEEVDDLQSNISDLDVLYMTRIQRERFASEEDYQAQKGQYILDTEKMSYAKKDMIVLHPLPRVDEITVEVDDDPRACYFKQAIYGMYGRMALIMLLLEDKDYFFHSNDKKFISDVKCKNPRCIVNQEAYLPKKYYLKDNHKICDYCDNEIE